MDITPLHIRLKVSQRKFRHGGIDCRDQNTRPKTVKKIRQGKICNWKCRDRLSRHLVLIGQISV
jgi:hypothetical protein